MYDCITQQKLDLFATLRSKLKAFYVHRVDAVRSDRGANVSYLGVLYPSILTRAKGD